MNQINPVKVVIVGDGSIGKTCVMVRFTQKTYSSDYVPTVFDNKTYDIVVEGHLVSLSLWDTAGQEAYARLRSVAYPNTDVFLVAFSVVNPQTFVNAKKNWISQIKREAPYAKILFVGTKIDLRESMQLSNNPKQRPLQKGQLQKHIKEEFNATYLECSALKNIGIQQIFTQAAKIMLIDRGTIKADLKKSVNKPIKEEQIKQEGACAKCQLI